MRNIPLGQVGLFKDNDMNDEMKEMMEQLEQIIDPILLMSRRMYQKMSNNPGMWKDLAQCHKTAVDAFIEAGFSREEAISMAIAALNNLGSKK